MTLLTFAGLVLVALLVGELFNATFLGSWAVAAWRALTSAASDVAGLSLRLASLGHGHVLEHYWFYSTTTGVLAVCSLATRPVPQALAEAEDSCFEMRPWADMTSSIVAGYLVFSYPFALSVALPHGGARALITVLAIAPPAFVALIHLYRVASELPVVVMAIGGAVYFGLSDLPLLVRKGYVTAFCFSVFGALVASLNFYWEACREADAHVSALKASKPPARAVEPEVPVADSPTDAPAT